MLKFLKALAIFTGTLIGVGIFGLPYVASQAGFFVIIFYFFVLSGIVTLTHLIYGEICLKSDGHHRFPGYIKEYFGTNWERFSLLLMILGLGGALLAYLIVGGKFLNSFFSPFLGGNEIIYSLIFFSIGSYLIFHGIKAISGIELFLLIVFFCIIALFFIRAIPFIDVNNLININLNFFGFSYGVILFSLWAITIVPEIREIVGKDQKVLKKVIVSGILISVITYLIFIFIALGVSGANTSEEAISGLVSVLGNNILKVGFLFGIITCFTSFLTIGLTFKKIFWYDFGLSEKKSWFIACFFPLLLFLIGFREFIDVIAFTGALAIGGEGIMIVFLYKAFLKKEFSKKMNPMFYILPLFFTVGIFLEIFYFITR